MSIVIAIVALAAGVLIGQRVGSRSDDGQLAAERARREELSRNLTNVTSERDDLRASLDDHRERVACLVTQAEADRRQVEQLQADEGRLVAQFEALTNKMLSASKDELVKTANETLRQTQALANKDLDAKHTAIDSLLKPIKENLATVERHVNEATKERKEEFGQLAEHLRTVAATNARVERTASELANVMSSNSSVRGRWGEHQLRRLFDIAGMIENVDYIEQPSVATETGRARADFVVLLPQDVKIAVDSKVPFEAYQAALNASEVEDQKRLLKDHAAALKTAVDGLVQRRYWEAYSPSLGFCVLFVAGDSTLQAALDVDPTLWEYAMTRNVLLASPSTVIAMLRVTAESWRQQRQADNAAEIAAEGKKLYDRLCKVSEHLSKVGKHLDATVKSFNELVGSHERMVTPAARNLSKLGAGTTKEFIVLDEITRLPKDVSGTTSPLVTIAAESSGSEPLELIPVDATEAN